MFAVAPRWEALPRTLPLDNAVRLDLREGIPVFRATPRVQNRIEALLEKQQMAPLSAVEESELREYEELDDFLSLVNRLVRNLVQGNGRDTLRSADGLHVVGLTDVGRATVNALELNRDRAVSIRAADREVGRHPPAGDRRLP